MKKLMALLLGLACLIQLGAIGNQIWTYERVLKEGEAFWFNVRPLDPYDPFRGRYVTLRFEKANEAPLEEDEIMPATFPQKGFALLERRDQGAAIRTVTLIKPLSKSYLEVDVFGRSQPKNKNTLLLVLPFNRFYMREDIAPLAEKVLRNQTVNVKAKLRVLEGKGVIENLFVGDIPLAEYALSQEVKTLQ